MNILELPHVAEAKGERHEYDQPQRGGGSAKCICERASHAWEALHSLSLDARPAGLGADANERRHHRPAMRAPCALRGRAPICGSFCGSNHGQKEERPAARAQRSAAARAPGLGHASDRAHDPRQACQGAETQEEVGGSGIELDRGSAARAISGLTARAAIQSGTSCPSFALAPSAKFSAASEIPFRWK